MGGRVVGRVGAGLDQVCHPARGQDHHPGVVAEGFPQAGLKFLS